MAIASYEVPHKCPQVLFYYHDNYIRLKVKELDPVAVEERQRDETKSIRILIQLGTNYLWHCDGYDKLSPYGLTIHGSIDG